jgi:hypothetical protein
MIYISVLLVERAETNFSRSVDVENASTNAVRIWEERREKVLCVCGWVVPFNKSYLVICFGFFTHHSSSTATSKAYS